MFDMVDLAGRLTNPSSQLERACALLPELLKRIPGSCRSDRSAQRQVRLSNVDIRRLVDDRHSGLTIVALAARYGIHRTTVMEHLRRQAKASRSSV